MAQFPYLLQTLRQTRSNFQKMMDEYAIEELNVIPAGFNNNLIWNFGHSIVTQQLLCYGKSGQPLYIPKDIVDRYRKGSKPEHYINSEEYAQFKQWNTELVDRFEKDLKQGMFSSYESYTTSYGLTLSSLEEGLTFNNIHEGMHYGVGLALRKQLR